MTLELKPCAKLQILRILLATWPFTTVWHISVSLNEDQIAMYKTDGYNKWNKQNEVGYISNPCWLLLYRLCYSAHESRILNYYTKLFWSKPKKVYISIFISCATLGSFMWACVYVYIYTHTHTYFPTHLLRKQC